MFIPVKSHIGAFIVSYIHMRITFCGGVSGVTGSCFVLETKQEKILIDCGMFQGEGMVKESDMHFEFDARDIKAVVLTQAHYDHCGRLPMLAKEGFRGKIYCTPPTKLLSKIILEDAQHLMFENNLKLGTPILFDANDVAEACSLISTVNYHTKFEIVDGINVSFFDAGHILGSAFIAFDIGGKHFKDKEARRIVFSGDIGNDKSPILPNTESISSADILVCESTYGDREHEPADARHRKLKEVINKVIGNGGTLLIPAFSVERTQELLYELDKMIDEKQIPHCIIYLDSPLSIKATQIYQDFSSYLSFDRNIFSSPDRNFFNFPNLKLTQTIDDSKSINEDNNPKIIIAGAGMMNGGRILHHLKRYIEDKRSGVLIIGYQAQGTLGRKIFDGEKIVNIFGEDYQVNASVDIIGAFSAHGDRIKLRNWMQTAGDGVKQIYIVHGEEIVKEAFREYVEEKIDCEIIIPQYCQSFEI